MKIFTFKYKIVLFVILLAVSLSSCKTDEFKLNELGIKETWNTDLVVPLFSGNMEFSDFITDWHSYTNEITGDEQLTTLKYVNEYYRLIPTQLIFEPAVIIDSFPLLIQGKYEMSSITLEFYVNNASPYPLNLEMQFYNKLDKTNIGPPVQPGVFSGGEIEGNVINPVPTTRTVDFSQEQVNSFNNGNRVRFISWYNQNSYLKDTLLANYPINVSIVLKGRIKGKNEN